MNRNDLDDMLGAAMSFSLENDSDAVLFLGNPTSPIPAALIRDRDLPPWARLVWCNFRQYSDSPAAAGIAPTYETIQADLGISGRGTVSAAIHALRVTRWITLKQVADNRRHVYLIHDAPITFLQAVEINPDYTDHISEAIRSPSKQVRELARLVLDGAMETAESDGPLSELYRLASVPSQHSRGTDGSGSLTWGTFNLRGSGNIPETGAPAAEEAVPVELDFHDELLGFTKSLKSLAEIKIRSLPAEYRQSLLDELAYKVLSRWNTDNPVRTPLAYLNWFVNHYEKKGELPLTGEGERLPQLLESLEARRRSEEQRPLRDEITKLSAELQHFRRLISYSDEPDQHLQESLKKTERRMREVQAQFGGAADVTH